jgi:biotin carboxyl carrier protein
VPEPDPRDARRPSRPPAERAADHAAIDRLAAELLPALIAKLGATGLGELEVREGQWRVRLRRPADGVGKPDRRRGDRDRGERGDRADRGDRGDRGDRADRSGRSGHGHQETVSSRTESRGIATSPAVGIFRPRTEVAAGTRVRAGDRLGAVDMLGIAQEVVSPVDGIVGASLVEPGDAVEYGQELLVIEFAPVPMSTNGTGA